MASFRERVERVLDELRPSLRADGGDVSLASADEQTGRVEVRLEGACSSCVSQFVTLQMGVETRLKEAIPSVKQVVSI